MKFDDVIMGRRSIRGYKPDPVPRALIEEIIALAMRAPSSMNVQPWNFYVITGEPLDRIRAGNTERNVAGVPHSREFRIGGAFFSHLRTRFRRLEALLHRGKTRFDTCHIRLGKNRGTSGQHAYHHGKSAFFIHFVASLITIGESAKLLNRFRLLILNL